MSDALNVLMGLIWLLLVFAAYWTPSIVAVCRKMPNVGSILVVNGFLGWTFIGWIVALAMACGRSPRPQPAP